MQIRNVGIAGCGQMGRQIGMNAAISGYQVKLFDALETARSDAAAWAQEYLRGRIEKSRMSAEQVKEVKGF